MANASNAFPGSRVFTGLGVAESAPVPKEFEGVISDSPAFRPKDQLCDERVELRDQINQALIFEEIVGSSAGLRTVLSSVVKVAPTDSTVLITGETGTGRELIVHAIHKRSGRAGHPFISVNCAAIPTSLIASELAEQREGERSTDRSHNWSQ